MAYSHTNSRGIKYYLNGKMSTLRGGHRHMSYYFSKDVRPEGCDLPSDRQVVENPRNGVPFLRKKK